MFGCSESGMQRVVRERIPLCLEARLAEPVPSRLPWRQWRLLHNTGNFIDSVLGGASMAAKNDIKSVPYGPIP
jgi:hypothetical protein